jgi:hypothetical protein
VRAVFRNLELMRLALHGLWMHCSKLLALYLKTVPQKTQTRTNPHPTLGRLIILWSLVRAQHGLPTHSAAVAAVLPAGRMGVALLASASNVSFRLAAGPV